MADDINIRVTHIFEGLASAGALGTGSPADNAQSIAAMEIIGQEARNENPDNNQKPQSMENLILALEKATTAMTNLASGNSSSGESPRKQRLEDTYARAQGGLETARSRKGMTQSKALIEAEQSAASAKKYFNSMGELTDAGAQASKEIYKFASNVSDINRHGRGLGLKLPFFAGLASYGVNQAAQGIAYGAQGLTLGASQYNQFQVNNAAALASAGGSFLTTAGLGLMASGGGIFAGAISAAVGTALTAGSTLYQAYAGADVTNQGRANLVGMSTTNPNAVKLIKDLANGGSQLPGQIPATMTAISSYNRYHAGSLQQAYNLSSFISKKSQDANIDFSPLIPNMSYLNSKFGQGTGKSFFSLLQKIGTNDMFGDMQSITNLSSMTSMSRGDLYKFTQNTAPLGSTYQQSAASMVLSPQVDQGVQDLMLKSLFGVSLADLNAGDTPRGRAARAKFLKGEDSYGPLGGLMNSLGLSVETGRVIGQKVLPIGYEESLHGARTKDFGDTSKGSASPQASSGGPSLNNLKISGNTNIHIDKAIITTNAFSGPISRDQNPYVSVSQVHNNHGGH